MPKDAHLAFTVMPVLEQDMLPPAVKWSHLRIVSPPEQRVVLKDKPGGRKNIVRAVEEISVLAHAAQ